MKSSGTSKHDPVSVCESVVFDLDGTLVDSRPGIEWAAQEAITKTLPELEPPALGPFIGPPLAVMLERALPNVTSADRVVIEERFRALYDGGAWRQTLIYDGMADVLAQLAEAGVSRFVVTNKPWLATQRILSMPGLAGQFDAALCPDGPEENCLSKADSLKYLIRTRNLAPESSVYVGDTHDDRLAAQSSGMSFIAVNYGHGRAGQESGVKDIGVIRHPMQLLPLVLA